MIHALFVTRDSNRHQVIDGLLEGDGREAITIHQVADLAAAAEASSAGGVDGQGTGTSGSGSRCGRRSALGCADTGLAAARNSLFRRQA